MRVLANRGVRTRLDYLARRAEGEDAPVEHEQPVEPVVDAIEIVRRHDDRQPAVDELAYDDAQCLFGLRVDAGRRLVEQQQPRLLRDRARDEDALLLAARQVGDVTHPPARPCSPPRARRARRRGRARRSAARTAAARSAPSQRRPTRLPGTTSRRPRPAARRRSFPAAGARLRSQVRTARRCVGVNRPAIVLSSVDFPEPLGPTMPSASP